MPDQTEEINNPPKKKRKLWEKILMGAVIGGAIGSVVGGAVGKSDKTRLTDDLKLVVEETKKPTRKILGSLLRLLFKKKREDEVKKIPHEEIK